MPDQPNINNTPLAPAGAATRQGAIGMFKKEQLLAENPMLRSIG